MWEVNILHNHSTFIKTKTLIWIGAIQLTKLQIIFRSHQFLYVPKFSPEYHIALSINLFVFFHLYSYLSAHLLIYATMNTHEPSTHLRIRTVSITYTWPRALSSCPPLSPEYPEFCVCHSLSFCL